MSAQPFCKWVGGKTQLLPELRRLLPPSFGDYYEPFVGGGALFFALAPKRAFLSDACAELIEAYRGVRDDVDGVIQALQGHVYEKDHYYFVRALAPASLPLAERAARMIYLNKTCFNGLYRVNASGQFNVPFGRYTNPLICDESNLRACSAALQSVRLDTEDFFAAVTDRVKPGDLVYFDPPYVPASKTSNFTGYTAGGFGTASQGLLAALFSDLRERGVHVMLSNSDTPEVMDLYRKHYVTRVQAKRSVNSKAGKRGAVGEVIVTSYEPPEGCLRVRRPLGEGARRLADELCEPPVLEYLVEDYILSDERGGG